MAAGNCTELDLEIIRASEATSLPHPPPSFLHQILVRSLAPFYHRSLLTAAAASLSFSRPTDRQSCSELSEWAKCLPYHMTVARTLNDKKVLPKPAWRTFCCIISLANKYYVHSMYSNLSRCDSLNKAVSKRPMWMLSRKNGCEYAYVLRNSQRGICMLSPTICDYMCNVGLN